jgi:hypothetical protein
MKKISLIWVVVIVAITSLALAEPFLTCDPQTDATKFRLRLSPSTPWVEGPAVSGAMMFDLGGTTPGTYNGEAQAGGTFQVVDSVTGSISSVDSWSPSAPFVLTVRAGNRPAKVKTTK